MANPWAAAAAVLFRAPGSVAAVYIAPNGAKLSVRAIRSTNPVDVIIGSRAIEAGATLIELQSSDFAGVDFEPVQTGMVLIGDIAWTIIGTPRLDTEGVSWTCEGAET